MPDSSSKNPMPDTSTETDAAATAWAKMVSDYLSGADNCLARILDDRPVSSAEPGE